MVIKTTDLYKAAWFMMNGGKIYEAIKIPKTIKVWRVSVSGMPNDAIEKWETFQATGNLRDFKNKRLEVKKITEAMT